LLAAENREVVDATLAARSELQVVPIDQLARAPAPGANGQDFMVAPDTHGTDGFYACVMKRA
jgi:16S rRNA C967 or C1407 C5-methylase (RsmB/RsmF family)